MRTHITLISCAALTPLLAQPTFTLASLEPELGPTPMNYSVNHVAPGPATANFTFNTGALILGAASQSEFISPGSTQYAGSFPQATHASVGGGFPGSTYYQLIDATGFYLLGGAGPDFLNLYSDPVRSIALPLSMGTTWTDPWASTFDLGGTVSTSEGTTTGAYNGYGTLILPWGTFTVGRVEINDSSTQDYSGFIATIESTTVQYYAQGFKLPLFTTTTSVITQPGQPTQTNTSSNVLDPTILSINANADAGPSFILFPNPTEGNTTLRLGGDLLGTINIRVIDMLGRIILQQIAVSAGVPQDIELGLSGFGVGLYHVTLTDDAGRIRTQPLMLR